jgi:hypothetical protein
LSAAVALALAWVSLLVYFSRPLITLWREPVVKVPVLILESDDWGPAPPEHAKILNDIARVLAEFRDDHGRAPTITLGVVLATPAPGRWHRGGSITESLLCEPQYEPLVAAMRAGVDAGVFALHLHGRSHYWPEALAAAADSQPAVAAWLAGSEAWKTEELPPELQSRWAPEIDGLSLTIPAESARRAAEQEASLFQKCLGFQPLVAVPNTFVWNEAVEQGWADGGVATIVTPGRYYRNRRQFADPDAAAMIVNGMRSPHARYVVRDQYFEPFKGHGANDGLAALQTNTELGRPTLLEIHRVNFLDPTLRIRSLGAIRELLRAALERYPGIRFLSTRELSDALADPFAGLISRSLARRVSTWCARVRKLRRFWQLARLIGFAWMIKALAAIALRRTRDYNPILASR